MAQVPAVGVDAGAQTPPPCVRAGCGSTSHRPARRRHGAAARAALALLALACLPRGTRASTDWAPAPVPGAKAAAAGAAGAGAEAAAVARPSPVRLVVQLDQGGGARATALSAGALGLRLQNGVAGGASVYTITDGESMDAKLARLRALPGVKWAEADRRVHVLAGTVGAKQFVPNDPLLGQQWHLNTAWALARGRPSVKVCHTDSGVRVGHPDLRGVVERGWNLVPADQSNAEEYVPVSSSDPQFYKYNDTYSHGTMTAGIIAAAPELGLCARRVPCAPARPAQLTNNKVGTASLAFGVKLLVCRFIWDDGSGWLSDAMNCWSLCAANNATIYSNSWGGVGGSEMLRSAMLQRQAKGHLMVMAAGNDGWDLASGKTNFPASFCLPCQINVAATDFDDNLAVFSDWGSSVVDMAAPGVEIWSTLNDLGYGVKSGTSFAAPMVAATAAASLSGGVTLTYAQLKAFLLSGADRRPSLQGRLISGARLNMERSVQLLANWLAARAAARRTAAAVGGAAQARAGRRPPAAVPRPAARRLAAAAPAG
eukprot:scaffold10.g2404.t1